VASALELLTLAMLTRAPSIPLVTGSVASSNAETVIGTFTVPANDSAAVAGSGYQFRINGLGGTQIGNQPGALTCRTTATGMQYAIDGWLYFITAGASAQLSGHSVLDESVSSATPVVHGNGTFGASNPGTFDSTAAWTLVLTATWGTSSASNIARTLTGGLYRI
jgi:hypothetical protein